MKKPQLEDGYTMIANELLEAIIGFGFTQRQFAVVMAILRKTYGFKKKEDDMSASQIGEICNMSRNHVTEVIGQLAKISVISKRQGSYGLILGINKDYKKWGVEVGVDSPKLGLVPNQDSPNLGLGNVVPIRDAASPNLGQVDSPNLGHTKENLSKETNKRKRATLCKTKFKDWMAKVRAEGQTPIPEDHSVFEYAEKIKLPRDYLRLCWLEFRNEHMPREDKLQKDWPKTFSVYVRKNYYRLWFKKDGQWQLTTAGIQLQDEMRETK